MGTATRVEEKAYLSYQRLDQCGIQTDGHIWSYGLMDTYGVMD